MCRDGNSNIKFMKDKEQEIITKLKVHKDELEKLNQELFNLRQKDRETYLRETYLGKCFFHDEGNWKTYLFVNKLIESSNTLYCVKLIFIDYPEHQAEMIESYVDFSCHYISDYSEDKDIDKCVEISKDEFNDMYSLILERISSKINS